MNDRAKYGKAVVRQQTERDLATGTPVPYRITQALDSRGLYGPQVDRDLGGEEPMVDLWEEGKLVPTPDQIKLLAQLTRFPISFFYEPASPDEMTGTAFLCSRSGPRGSRCQTIQLGPRTAAQPAPPPTPIAEVIPMPSRGPAWICRVPRCPIRGRRQPAPTNSAADAGLRRHYLDDHYQPPDQPAPRRPR